MSERMDLLLWRRIRCNSGGFCDRPPDNDAMEGFTEKLFCTDTSVFSTPCFYGLNSRIDRRDQKVKQTHNSRTAETRSAGPLLSYQSLLRIRVHISCSTEPENAVNVKVAQSSRDLLLRSSSLPVPWIILLKASIGEKPARKRATPRKVAALSLLRPPSSRRAAPPHRQRHPPTDRLLP